MRIPFHRRKNDLAKAIVGEDKYLDDLEKRKRFVDSVVSALNGPFGQVLMNALDAAEKDAFERLLTSRFQHTIAQAKAEIRLVRHIKQALQAYVVEKHQIDDAIKTMQEESYGEV